MEQRGKERSVSTRGREGLQRLMGSLGSSRSCNDLPLNGHLGLHALQTDDWTEIESGQRLRRTVIKTEEKGDTFNNGNNEGAFNQLHSSWLIFRWIHLTVHVQ